MGAMYGGRELQWVVLALQKKKITLNGARDVCFKLAQQVTSLKVQTMSSPRTGILSLIIFNSGQDQSEKVFDYLGLNDHAEKLPKLVHLGLKFIRGGDWEK